MSQIKVVDVLKVIDIHKTSMSETTINWLENERLTYRDQVAKENIYSMPADSYELDEVPAFVKNEIEAIMKLAEENDAAYVRIVYV